MTKLTLIKFQVSKIQQLTVFTIINNWTHVHVTEVACTGLNDNCGDVSKKPKKQIR